MMEHFDPESFFEIVERERISCTILAPAIINMLATHPSAAAANLSSLKVIYYSGAPISPTALSKAMEVFGPIFLQGYGSTEGGTVYNTILYPDEHVRALEHNPERLSSCGRPVPFFDVRLVDDDGHEVPVGEMGEIWVRGDAASVRYWNQPEATAQAYEDGWFKMGDLAIRDPEGYITIVDRKNDMIVSSGLNVYPPGLSGKSTTVNCPGFVGGWVVTQRHRLVGLAGFDGTGFRTRPAWSRPRSWTAKGAHAASIRSLIALISASRSSTWVSIRSNKKA